jgi:hypothetical protein
MNVKQIISHFSDL